MERDIVIEIDSVTEEVTLACVAANALFAHYSLPKLLCYQMELCVDEILNNIIEHDLHFVPGTRIRVQVHIADRAARICIRYRSAQPELGPWKDRRDAPAGALPERGFGCFLVAEIMDRVTVARDGDHNVFTLTKTLARPAVRKLGARRQSTEHES